MPLAAGSGGRFRPCPSAAMLYRPAMDPRAVRNDALLRAQRRDRTWGLLIVGLSFSAALGVSFWAHEVAHAPATPEPRALARILPGWPHAADPMVALALARRKTPLKNLDSFVLYAVKSDGTLDVTDAGRGKFVFFRARKAPAPRSKGTRSDPASCDRQVVRLDAKGVIAADVTSGGHCPDRHAVPLPDPPCGPRQLWEAALRKGVKPDARARLEYYRARSGPAWSFRVGQGRPKLVMDGRCARELTPVEARRRARDAGSRR